MLGIIWDGGAIGLHTHLFHFHLSGKGLLSLQTNSKALVLTPELFDLFLYA